MPCVSGFLLLAIADYEIYHKFVNDVLETERTTVNISEPALSLSNGYKKKIATAETLTVHQGSLTFNLSAAEGFTTSGFEGASPCGVEGNAIPVIRYQYDNHLGSASLELDENANIISYEEYHPFGTTSYRSGRTETETSQKRYKYVGKERDEETGLYYYGFRYYAAWLCRFVSVDPLKEERNWLTPHNYVQNNPVNRVDPTGALDEDPPKDIIQESFKNHGLTNGIVISTDKSTASSKIVKTKLMLDYKAPDNSMAQFNIQVSKVQISGDGSINSIEVKDLSYTVYQTKLGRVFSEGDLIVGKVEGELSLFGEDASNYVNENLPVVKSWSDLTGCRPDIVSSGKAPYRVSVLLHHIPNALRGKQIYRDVGQRALNDVADFLEGIGGIPGLTPRFKVDEIYEIPDSQTSNAPVKIKAAKKIPYEPNKMGKVD